MSSFLLGFFPSSPMQCEKGTMLRKHCSLPVISSQLSTSNCYSEIGSENVDPSHTDEQKLSCSRDTWSYRHPRKALSSTSSSVNISPLVSPASFSPLTSPFLSRKRLSQFSPPLPSRKRCSQSSSSMASKRGSRSSSSHSLQQWSQPGSSHSLQRWSQPGSYNSLQLWSQLDSSPSLQQWSQPGSSHSLQRWSQSSSPATSMGHSWSSLLPEFHSPSPFRESEHVGGVSERFQEPMDWSYNSLSQHVSLQQLYKVLQ